MAALHGKNASVAIASGASAEFSTAEALTANAARTVYTIGDAALRLWDPDEPVVVERSTDGGTTWSTVSSGYTVQYLGGKVTFGSAQAVGTQVRATAYYFTSTAVGQAYEWSVSLALDTVDVSTFGDSYKAYIPVMRSATASISDWWLDETYLTDLGAKVVLSLDTGAGRYEGYAWLAGNSVTAAVDNAVAETLDFSFDGEVFYNAA